MNPDLTDMKTVKGFEAEDPNDASGADDSETEKPARRSGRRKIKIEYIEDKNRRHITFSKRKAGIMKKAYELSTLTGTQVLLLVVSETGLVYTFTTVKLQPIVTKPEGKNLIQACLNAPDPMAAEQTGDASYETSPRVEDKKTVYDDKKVEASSLPPPPSQPTQSQQPPSQSSGPYSGGGYQTQQPTYQPQGSGGNNNNGYPGYNMAPGQAPTSYGSPQQQPQQSGYGQMSQPAFYGNQQQHYMPPQQQQQQPQGYWQGGQPGNSPSLPRQDGSPIIDDKSRRGIKK